MTKRALLYARVSTANQKDNSSIEGQLKRTREYANGQGYTIVEEDHEIISGKFILARTVLNRFFEMLGDGLADVIIVDVPDRLGRDDAIGKCELLAEMSGGAIEYTTKSYDHDTVEGVVMHHARGITSGVERIKTRERTVNGKNAYAEGGRIIASSYRPYGYRYERKYDPNTGKKIDCKLVIVEEETDIVSQIFEWCAYEGLSTHGIAKRLSEKRIPTLTDKDGGKRRKKNKYGVWCRDTVHGMLTNSTYKGEWRYNKHRVKRYDTPNGTRKRQTKRDEADQIIVPVPAIVSAELWQLAQNRLEEHKRRSFKPTKNKYLLRGRVKCTCGRSMTGYTQKSSGNQTYRCSAKYRSGKIGKRLCNVRNVDASMLEQGLWQFIVKLMTDEDLLFAKIRTQQDRAKKELKLIRLNIAALKAHNDKDESAVKRFLDLYGDGELDKQQYLQRRAEKQHKIEQRQAEIAELQQHLQDASPLPPDREVELKKLREKLSSRLGAATFEQKQQLYDLLQIECTYHDDTGQALVTGVFGTQALTVNVASSGHKLQKTDKSDPQRVATVGDMETLHVSIRCPSVGSGFYLLALLPYSRASIDT